MVQEEIKAKVTTFFLQFPKKTYKKGEMILRPEEDKGALFLKQGFVREYGISQEGIEVSIHIFVPNAYFPMSLVLSKIPNRYYYEALTDCEIYHAPKEAIIKFLKEHHEVLLDLTKRVLGGLDKLSARIEYLSYGTAYEKVVSTLLYLSSHFGEKKGNIVHIKETFTHRDIGSLAGITRETTSREWEKLERKGVLSFKNHHIVINNLQKLKEELLP